MDLDILPRLYLHVLIKDCYNWDKILLAGTENQQISSDL